MIHPDTELRKVNETIGNGVFALRMIPRGTIVYVKDPLEIEITPEQFAGLGPQYQTVVDWFSYIDERGCRIVSWDIAKYVNHCCDPNTISTGYGFEIAVRDIEAGEQITDEYGIFNLHKPLECSCSSSDCRRIISENDWDVHGRLWDKRARAALRCFAQVAQPLVRFMDTDLYRELMQYLNSGRNYRSLMGLRMLDETAVEKIG